MKTTLQPQSLAALAATRQRPSSATAPPTGCVPKSKGAAALLGLIASGLVILPASAYDSQQWDVNQNGNVVITNTWSDYEFNTDGHLYRFNPSGTGWTFSPKTILEPYYESNGWNTTIETTISTQGTYSNDFSAWQVDYNNAYSEPNTGGLYPWSNPRFMFLSSDGSQVHLSSLTGTVFEFNDPGTASLDFGYALTLSSLDTSELFSSLNGNNLPIYYGFHLFTFPIEYEDFNYPPVIVASDWSQINYAEIGLHDTLTGDVSLSLSAIPEPSIPGFDYNMGVMFTILVGGTPPGFNSSIAGGSAVSDSDNFFYDIPETNLVFDTDIFDIVQYGPQDWEWYVDNGSQFLNIQFNLVLTGGGGLLILDNNGDTAGYGDWSQNVPQWNAATNQNWTPTEGGEVPTDTWTELGGGTRTSVIDNIDQTEATEVLLDGAVNMANTRLLLRGNNFDVTLAGDGSLTFDEQGSIDVSNSNQTFIIGPDVAIIGYLNKRGEGTLDVGGSLNGTLITIEEGTLALTHAATNASTHLYLVNGTALEFRGSDTYQFGEFNSDSSTWVSAANGIDARIELVTNSNDSSFYGNLSDGDGTLGLTVTGNGGTLYLYSGFNDYSGDTIVQSASLWSSGGRLSANSVHYIEEDGNLYFWNDTIAGLSGQGWVEPIYSWGSPSLTIDQSIDTEFSGIISGNTTINKQNTGTLILSGNNSLTGVLNIQDGTVVLGSGGTSGSVADASSIQISDGAVLGLHRSDDWDMVTPIAGDGEVHHLGTGTTSLTSDNTYTGITRIFAGTLQAGDGGTTGSLGGGDVVNDGLLAFNRSNTYTAAQSISGSGGLIQRGDGIVVLTGTNTYGGTTTIENGTLQIGNGGTSGTLGTGNVLNDGVLAFNRSDSHTVGQQISGSGDLLQSGTGTTILTGTNSYLGTTTVEDGILQIGNGGTTGTLGVGDVHLNDGTLAINRSNTYWISQTITGNGDLRQSGIGTTILTGANDYAGQTTISAGTLQIGDGGTTGTIGTGDVVNDSILAVNRSNAYTLDQTISGSGGLIQQGSGTTTLTGSNLYSGSTQVLNGGLHLDGTHTGGGTYSVLHGALLTSSETASVSNADGVGNALVVQSGGRFEFQGTWNTGGGDVVFANSGVLSVGGFGGSRADSVRDVSFDMEGGRFDISAPNRSGGLQFDLYEAPGGTYPMPNLPTQRGDLVVIRDGTLAIGSNLSILDFSFNLQEPLQGGTRVLFDTDQLISGNLALNEANHPQYLALNTHYAFLGFDDDGRDLVLNVVRPINYQLIFEKQIVGPDTREADTQGQTTAETAFMDLYFGSINSGSFVSVYGTLNDDQGGGSLWYGRATGTADYPLRILSRVDPDEDNVLPGVPQTPAELARFNTLNLLNPDGSVREANVPIDAYLAQNGGSFVTMITNANENGWFMVGMPMDADGTLGTALYQRQGLNQSGDHWGFMVPAPELTGTSNPVLTGLSNPLLINHAGQALNLGVLEQDYVIDPDNTQRASQSVWLVNGEIVASAASTVEGFASGQRVGSFNAAGDYSPGIALAADGAVVFRGDGNYDGPDASPEFTDTVQRTSIFRAAGPDGTPATAVEVVLRGASFGLTDTEAASQRFTYQAAFANGIENQTIALAVNQIADSVSVNRLNQTATVVSMFNAPETMNNTSSQTAVVFVNGTHGNTPGDPNPGYYTTVVARDGDAVFRMVDGDFLDTGLTFSLGFSSDQAVATSFLSGGDDVGRTFFSSGLSDSSRSVFYWNEGYAAATPLFLPGETITLSLGAHLADIEVTLNNDATALGAWQVNLQGNIATELNGTWELAGGDGSDTFDFHGVVLWTWVDSLGTFMPSKIMMEGDTVDNTDGNYATLDWFTLPQDWVATNGEEGRPTWLNSSGKITFYGSLHYFGIDPDTGEYVRIDEEGVFAPYDAPGIGLPIPEPSTGLLVLLGASLLITCRRLRRTSHGTF